MKSAQSRHISRPRLLTPLAALLLCDAQVLVAMAEDGEEEPANQADVPRVTNLLDQAELKRVLDECASQIVIEAGFPESMFISNVKIGACGLPAFSPQLCH